MCLNIHTPQEKESHPECKTCSDSTESFSFKDLNQPAVVLVNRGGYTNSRNGSQYGKFKLRTYVCGVVKPLSCSFIFIVWYEHMTDC